MKKLALIGSLIVAAVFGVAQAQNTTVALGVNGAQASSINTGWIVPTTVTLTSATILVGTTPAAGQTFTFTLFDGANNHGSCTINNGSFSCTITPTSPSVAASQQIFIQSVFSATSGSSNIRYVVGYSS